MKTYALFVRPDGSSVRKRCVARGEAATPSAFWDAYRADAASVPERLTAKYVEVEVRDAQGELLMCTTIYPEDHVTAAPTDELEPTPMARPAFEDVLQGEALEKAIEKHKAKQRDAVLHEVIERALGATPKTAEALEQLGVAGQLTKEAADKLLDEMMAAGMAPPKSYNNAQDYLRERQERLNKMDQSGDTDSYAKGGYIQSPVLFDPNTELTPAETLRAARRMIDDHYGVPSPAVNINLDPTDADDVDGAMGAKSPDPTDAAQGIDLEKIHEHYKVRSGRAEGYTDNAKRQAIMDVIAGQPSHEHRLLRAAGGRMPGDTFDFEGDRYEMQTTIGAEPVPIRLE